MPKNVLGSHGRHLHAGGWMIPVVGLRGSGARRPIKYQKRFVLEGSRSHGVCHDGGLLTRLKRAYGVS